jgi:threonine synthase
MAKALGATEVCLPSAGNAGSALAAYAARGGIRAHVFVPRDIPSLFLLETRAYGAHVETVDGLITDAGRLCAEKAKQNGWYDCATLKEPYRVEGKKTMGYEIAEQLGWKLPDAILYPTGGGVGLIGMHKAFEEMRELGWVDGDIPRFVAVQSTGCAPIVRAFDAGATEAEPWAHPRTIAFGINVPKPLGDFLILRALAQSGGTAVAVDDDDLQAEVLRAGRLEGVFLCPEGGATISAARVLREREWIGPDDLVVVLNTGSGLIYPDAVAVDAREVDAR